MSNPFSIGTGLDINALVTQLVQAERAPVEARIQRQTTDVRADLSALGRVKGSLSALKEAIDAFMTEMEQAAAKRAEVQKEASFEAQAAREAAAAEYRIEVERLARAQTTQAAAQTQGAVFGAGSLTLTRDGEDTVINIAGGSTLNQVRDAINAQSQTSGVQATLIRGDAGEVLSLSSTATGVANGFTLSGSGSGSTLVSGSTTVAAQDARLSIDGVTVTSSTNTVDQAIQGVQLNLRRAEPGTAFTLTVGTDTSAQQQKAEAFVNAFNAANAVLRDVGKAGGANQTAGPLSGEAIVRQTSQALRGSLGRSADQLASLGFTFNTQGDLRLDASKLAVAERPRIQAVFLGSGSSGQELSMALDGLSGTQGILNDKTQGLDRRLEQLGKDKQRMEARSLATEARYRQQFVAMETLVTQLQTKNPFGGTGS